jgi:YidC/Oxa1 family membrane protein insertase
MDKRTLLAVVLSVIILIAGTVVMQVFLPKTPVQTAQTSQAPAASVAPSQQPTPAQSVAAEASPAAKPQAQSQAAAPGKVVAVADAGAEASGPKSIVRETDVYRMTFSREGGVLTSVQLKKFTNVDGSPVEMVYQSSMGQRPFEVSFGDFQEASVATVFTLRETVDSNRSVFDFSSTFLSASGVPFTLRKIYTFMQSEYVMELKIVVENSVNELPDLGAGQYAYTLGIGPQIGPRFKKLDGRSDYRSFVYYEAGKRKDLSSLSGKNKELPATQGLTWLGIVGKYFTIVAVPDATQYRYVFDGRKLEESFDRSSMYLERPPIQAAKSQDTFRFYIGPKTREILSRYNVKEKNSFGLEGLRLDEVVTSPFLIGWLAQLLGWLLELFYMLIPNYGIAIILVTLVTKFLFLPLTFKSSEATARMQALNPKMAEIRERLKGKPEKMNQEIAELYKKEKVNPLSGCLPLLLQLPIFFALYSLLNDNFALRGAVFIPGWINDLSATETVWEFGSFTVPIVGWSGLHLLPFLMVATQFFFTKFTQSPDASQQGGQMKMFTYLMPLMMFFLLYETPSGLVLYWTVQNILSVLQQLYINHVNKKKKELAASGGAVSQRRKLT